MTRRAGRDVRRVFRRLQRLPRSGQALLAAAGLALATVAWQVARKPTEIVTAIVPAAPKPPARTWEAYGDAFEAHATSLIRPELLAALAQAESAGDPLASPAWELRWSTNPLDLYGPPSSAVGLLQMTDANLADARRLCVHGHEVARDGTWSDPRACWLNGLYSRLVPGHAIEMTAAWLDTSVREIAAAQRLRALTPARTRSLAAVIHLCGRGRAAEYARRGFWTLPGERCGEQDVGRYVARVEALARQFEALRTPAAPPRRKRRARRGVARRAQRPPGAPARRRLSPVRPSKR